MFDPGNGADMRRLEFLRQFLQYGMPIDSTGASSGCTTLRRAGRSTSLPSERGDFSLVISQPS